MYSLALGTVTSKDWDQVTKKAAEVSKAVKNFEDNNKVLNTNYKTIDEIGKHLVQNSEKRICWLELFRAIAECLPHDEPKDEPKNSKDISSRNELHITNMECQEVNDVAQWLDNVKLMPWFQAGEEPAEKEEEAEEESADSEGKAPGTPSGVKTSPSTNKQPAPGPQTPPTGKQAPPSGKLTPPTGKPAPPSGNPAGLSTVPAGSAAATPETSVDNSGWIISISGYHYHNSDDQDHSGAQYVRETLIKNLNEKKITFPGPNGSEGEEVSMSELGILMPVLCNPRKVVPYTIENPYPQLLPDPEPSDKSATDPVDKSKSNKVPSGTAETSKQTSVGRFDFTVQFIWQPKTAAERHEAKRRAEEENPSEPGPTKP
jgi:hypothetical protein